MIVAPPGVPVTANSAPSGSSTMLGDIDDSIRFPGAIALFSPCTSPNWFGVPGLAARSSMSLLSRNPAPGTVTLLPKNELTVVVTETAFPSASTME